MPTVFFQKNLRLNTSKKTTFNLHFFNRTQVNYIGRFGEIPESEENKVPESDKNLVMHVSLPIGKSILMGSDCGGEWAPSFKQGNNFSVSITADSKDEADQLFNGLAEGGKITMPLADTFWGDYFGMLTDKFGINWMMSYNKNQQ